MIVLVCGDRNWKAYGPILRSMEALDHNSVEIVIDGAAPGADTIGHQVAKDLGLPYRRFPANWNLYGRAAGPIRNRQMLMEGKPNLVLAFHKDLRKSKGTADMIRIALKAGIEVRVHPPQDIDFLK